MKSSTYDGPLLPLNPTIWGRNQYPQGMRLPMYVERHRGKFRGWAMIGGKRYRTKVYADHNEAFFAAMELRKNQQAENRATLGEVMEIVLRDTKLLRSEGTLSWYQDHFEMVRKNFNTKRQISVIKPKDIEEFIEKRLQQVKPATVNHDLRALTRVFNVALKRGLIARNPMAQVDRPSSRSTRYDYFEFEELPAILTKIRNINPADADMVTILAYTGMRRQTMCRLTCEDIDFRGMRLWLRSKKDDRELPIPGEIVTALRRMMLAVKGVGLLIQGGDREFDRIMGRCKTIVRDKRFKAHTFRHTVATALIKKGVPLHVVQQITGHKTLHQLMRYYHHSGEAREAIGKLGT